MRISTALFALGLAVVASAQIFNDDDDQTDLPAACTSTCQTFEDAAATCSQAGDETASLACTCTQANGDALASCVSCIISNGGDPSSTNAGANGVQLAISFTRGCGIPLSIDGVSPAVSSVLANGGADYASERSSLLNTDNIVKTVSNGMEITLTVSTTTSSPATATSTVSRTSSGSQTSMTASASGASQTGTPDSGAGFLQVGSASFLAVGATALLAHLA
ncbi:hypothetical protein JCM8097_006060 [Rhodosporidiobolus ruineniae]